MAGTKFCRELEKKIKKATKWSVTITPEMGIEALADLSRVKKFANPTNLKNGMMTPSDLRKMMTREEWADQKYAWLLNGHQFCEVCGAPLGYEDREQKKCRNCRKKLDEERRRQDIIRAFGMQQRLTTAVQNPSSTTTTPVSPEPSAPAEQVQLLDEEQQKELNKSMCRIGSFDELLRHAPDRAVVMVHIENYSPTINYYGAPDNKG